MCDKKYIGRVFFFSGNKRNKEDFSDVEFDGDNLLCRFVLDGLGHKLGESIALSDDVIIVKSKKKYLGIPLKHVHEKENNLIVKGLVDKEKALEMGENWRKLSFDNIESKDEEK
jgi:hypothetical protein